MRIGTDLARLLSMLQGLLLRSAWNMRLYCYARKSPHMVPQCLCKGDCVFPDLHREDGEEALSVCA